MCLLLAIFLSLALILVISVSYIAAIKYFMDFQLML